MDDKSRKEFISLFNQGFEEVVMPQIEDLREEMNERFDKLASKVGGLEKSVDGLEANGERLESRVDGMDRKLDIVLDRQKIQSDRLSEIEVLPVIAHDLKAKKIK